jgi:hypothetical protein
MFRAVHLGRAWWAGTKHVKKARLKHDTTRNYFGSGRPGTMYQVGMGRSRGPWAGTSPARLCRHGKACYKARKGPLHTMAATSQSQPQPVGQPSPPCHLPLASQPISRLHSPQATSHFIAHKNGKTLGLVPLSLVLS